MNISDIITPTLADAALAQSPMYTIGFYVLIITGMWFLLIAPQRKKQKQHTQMVQALGTGDKVITSGGIYGTITNVKKNRLVLKIADDTKIEIHRSSIQGKAEEDEE